MGANEIEIGKQWNNNKMLPSLSAKRDFLGCLRRNDHVTDLYKHGRDEFDGDFLGSLVHGIEDEEVPIFGATLF